MAVTRDDALELDAKDPLAAFRDRFVIDDERMLYLDGNSLGRLPKGTRERLHRVIDQWGSELVGGWHDWIDAPTRTGDALAEVLGAQPGTILVADSVTVNLFKLVNAILDSEPSITALATDQDNFPTDRYVLEGIARARGLDLTIFDGRPAARPAARRRTRRRAHRPLARRLPLRRARRHRGLPRHRHLGPQPLRGRRRRVELERRGVRYAVGCTYKYLNAGPGATGYVYVREPETLVTPIQGWFGQARQFEMERPYEPAPGITRFLAGTPPILVLAAVEEGVRITAEAGIDAIREKSIAQTELLIALHDQWLAPLGFTVGTPARAAPARLPREPAPPERRGRSARR